MAYINGKKILFSPIVNTTNTPATLIEKEITENGTYNAIDEGANGFSSVTVNVASSGGDSAEADIVDGLLQGTLSGVLYNDRVTKLRDNAFSKTSFTKIELPNLTSIGTYAFNSCKSLVEAILPLLSTTSMYCFSACESLKNIYLPKAKSVTTYCFSGCSKLETAIFPNITLLANKSMENCSNLKTLVIGTEISQVCQLGAVAALTGTPIANGTGFIYVPDNLVEQYKVATNWSTYATQIKGISLLNGDGNITFTISGTSMVDGGEVNYSDIVPNGTTWREWCESKNAEVVEYGVTIWDFREEYVYDYLNYFYVVDSNGNPVLYDSEIVGGEYHGVVQLPKITFTVDGVSYTVNKGTTWEQLANERPDICMIDGNEVWGANWAGIIGFSSYQSVRPTDLIIDGEIYIYTGA